MLSLDRRAFVGTASAAALGATLAQSGGQAQDTPPVDALQICPFRFDVTPPQGHSLCGGWITPVEAVDDPLEAIGFVMLGGGDPIVLCVVDWTGLLNEAHLRWRETLAAAAGTSIDRVTVHCVHQHNAPFACLESERIVLAQGDLPHIVEIDFFNRCLQSAEAAVSEAIRRPQPITHVAHGEAEVHQVASNRRILGPDGRVVSQRGSSSRNPEHHQLPEGLIDPMLKTVAFYNGSEKVAACHYYACHPMSYYGDGRVSSDFCGLARKRRQEEEPECTHLYFNGCGGDIGAGKYNDGSKPMRAVLTGRIYDAMVRSENQLRPEPIASLRWATQEILPPPHPRFNEAELMQRISDPSQAVVNRNRSAYTVAWLRRYQSRVPITVAALHVNAVAMLHLPSESFVEYQLEAQAAAADRFVACAAYGDGGPWYVPTAEAYPQGGYAVSVAWCDPQIDDVFSAAIRKLLAA